MIHQPEDAESPHLVYPVSLIEIRNIQISDPNPFHRFSDAGVEPCGVLVIRSEVELPEILFDVGYRRGTDSPSAITFIDIDPLDVSAIVIEFENNGGHVIAVVCAESPLILVLVNRILHLRQSVNPPIDW